MTVILLAELNLAEISGRSESEAKGWTIVMKRTGSAVF